jgi:hypothetical protein
VVLEIVVMVETSSICDTGAGVRGGNVLACASYNGNIVYITVLELIMIKLTHLSPEKLPPRHAF